MPSSKSSGCITWSAVTKNNLSLYWKKNPLPNPLMLLPFLSEVTTICCVVSQANSYTVFKFLRWIVINESVPVPPTTRWLTDRHSVLFPNLTYHIQHPPVNNKSHALATTIIQCLSVHSRKTKRRGLEPSISPLSCRSLPTCDHQSVLLSEH